MSDDSWESSNLDSDIVDEFEWSQLMAAKRDAKLTAKPPKAPPVPFTRALADAESDEVRRCRHLPCAAPPPPRPRLITAWQGSGS